MVKVNIHEIKAKLSHYLKIVQNGETVIICKRNIPIAEISPTVAKKGDRPVGMAKKMYPDWSFDLSHAADPLYTNEEIEKFENTPLFPSA